MLLKVIATGSKGNCYALDDGENILLLDFGIESMKIMRGINYRITDCVGALLSHIHADHSKSYKWLLNNWIQIYTNDETAEHLEVTTGEKVKRIAERQLFKVGKFQVRAFYVPHDGTPNFAYLIEHSDMGRMIYATDFETLPFSFKQAKINHWLIECNYQDDLIASSLEDDEKAMHTRHSLLGHCSLTTVKRIIEKNCTNALRTITLCHLSEGFSNPQQMVTEVKSLVGADVVVQTAFPGLEVNLNLCPF